VCFDVTFAQLKVHEQQHHGGIEELRHRFGCGRGCAMCVPYIKLMLETGRTSFSPDDPMSSADRPADL
jgi:bacterioferritin-associated ferredoxin